MKLLAKTILPLSIRCKPSLYKQSALIFLLSIYYRPLALPKFEIVLCTCIKMSKLTFVVKTMPDMKILLTS